MLYISIISLINRKVLLLHIAETMNVMWLMYSEGVGVVLFSSLRLALLE